MLMPTARATCERRSYPLARRSRSHRMRRICSLTRRRLAPSCSTVAAGMLQEELRMRRRRRRSTYLHGRSTLRRPRRPPSCGASSARRRYAQRKVTSRQHVPCPHRVVLVPAEAMSRWETSSRLVTPGTAGIESYGGGVGSYGGFVASSPLLRGLPRVDHYVSACTVPKASPSRSRLVMVMLLMMMMARARRACMGHPHGHISRCMPTFGSRRRRGASTRRSDYTTIEASRKRVRRINGVLHGCLNRRSNV